jgi:hypothetical protein
MVPIDMANVPSARTAQPKWVNPTYSSKDKTTAAFTESPPCSAAVVGEWRTTPQRSTARHWRSTARSTAAWHCCNVLCDAALRCGDRSISAAAARTDFGASEEHKEARRHPHDHTAHHRPAVAQCADHCSGRSRTQQRPAVRYVVADHSASKRTKRQRARDHCMLHQTASVVTQRRRRAHARARVCGMPRPCVLGHCCIAPGRTRGTGWTRRSRR